VNGVLFAPVGELPYDPHEDRVQCHLCGRWFRALAPGHLRRHDLTADEYREIAGLTPRHPLGVPSLSALRAAQLRERIARDKRIQDGMRVGIALARSGQLQAQARTVATSRQPRPQRERDLVAAGRRIGTGRAVAYRERREAAARALGFGTLETYLRERYVHQRIRIEDLAAELGASVSAVRGDLDRFSIEVGRGAPRRGRLDPR
jgi:hypothetical protein